MEALDCSLARLAATLAETLGIEPPKQAEPALPFVAPLLAELASGPLERCLLHNPDAVAAWLYRKYAPWFEPVLRHTQLALPLRSPLPSVTPVCFGTMYTGAQPEVHGIQAYEKPVIRIDSLFDALARAGWRTAIVAVEGSSMSRIYLDRAVEYHFLPDDSAVLEKAVALLEADAYDFLSVYTQSYDDTMHRCGVEAEESLQALRSQIEGFDRLATAAKAGWKGKNALLGFCTDHGVHNYENGKGGHGSDSPLDTRVLHFLGVAPSGT